MSELEVKSPGDLPFPNRIPNAEFRIQLHYAIQFIAATGMALGTPQPDGSQMTLDWNPEIEGFMGIKLTGTHPCYVALEPTTLTSLILDEQKCAIASLPLPNKTMTSALAWHHAELTKLGSNADTIALLDYPDDFPDHPLAHGAVFDANDEAGRSAVVAYFTHTRPLLQDIVTTRSEASPVYIWPHHFDMATLITLSGKGETAQTIGVGLSPGDSSYDQPYWYVTPWPYPPQAKLPALSWGNWHTEGWIGAILTAAEVGNPTLDKTEQSIQAFLEEAVSICYELLE